MIIADADEAEVADAALIASLKQYRTEIADVEGTANKCRKQFNLDWVNPELSDESLDKLFAHSPGYLPPHLPIWLDSLGLNLPRG